MRKYNLYILSALLCLSFAGIAFSAPNNPAKRPKIGLVLSGGGARGFAHIGVLQVIDSLHIPIDYIAGTSMGAVVGGLYAMGFTASQIDSIARSIEWESIFSDLPPRRQLPYFQKEEVERFQISFGIEHFRLIPPSGLIAGQKVSMLLSKLTLPQFGITDFDSLPLPFRCAAVDLISGNEVVLKSGHLAKAIRASMSVPSVFSPVDWGDSLLVDGGVLNNLPVDVVKSMGADSVIAVNVGTPMRGRKELVSALTILFQSYSLAAYKREEQNLKDAQIILTPDLTNYSNTDFNNSSMKEMIQKGREIARHQIPQLEHLKRSVDSMGPAIPKKSIRKIENPIVYRVMVLGNKRLHFTFIYQLLGIKPGDPLDLNILKRRIEHLYSLGYFELISYDIEHQNANRYSLILRVKEKQQRLFRLGLQYRSDKKAIIGVNFKINDFPFSGLRNDFTFLFSGLQYLEWEVGRPTRQLSTQLYPYFYTYYRDIPLDLYYNHEKIANYKDRAFGAAFGIGFIIKNYGIIRAEYNYDKLDITTQIASPGEIVWPEWQYPIQKCRIISKIDLLDDALLPRHGYLGFAEYEQTLDFINQREKYSRFYMKHSFYGTALPYTTTSIHFNLGIGHNLQYYRYFYLGGPDSFVGADYDEFSGPNVGIYRLENRTRIYKSIYFLSVFNAGNLWQAGDRFSLSKDFYTGYGAGFLIDTIAGPFRFLVGHGDGQTRQYFTLGFILSRFQERR